MKKKRNAEPKYRVIANKVIRKIQRGSYAPGEKLKGMRALAQEHGVSFQVIISAIQLLAQRGYVITRRKSGVFINPERLGRFSRLGMFVNNYNPCAQGKLTAHLFSTARQQGYELLQGTNDSGYSGGSELEDWLNKTREIDGVFMVGSIREKDLASLRCRELPYLVLGNYKIRSDHPQLILPVAEIICKRLLPHFAPFAQKRIAALVGSKTSRSDRETLDGIRMAIQQVGGTVYDELLLFAESGGLREVTKLLEELQPDVLYLHGLHRDYARYCRENPEATRPFLLGNPESCFLTPDQIDGCVEEVDTNAAYAKRAIELLSSMIHHQVSRSEVGVVTFLA